MPKSNARSVKLRTELTARLLEKYQEQLLKRPKKISSPFEGFVNDLITKFLDKDDFLRSYASSISLVKFGKNVLNLRDKKVGKMNISISVQKGELWCEYHESGCCEHVRYAFAIPEVVELNLRRS